jgi:hypothetical protein
MWEQNHLLQIVISNEIRHVDAFENEYAIKSDTGFKKR